MAYLIVEAKDKKEEKFIREMLFKMNVSVRSEKEEDLAFEKAMAEVDFSKKVSLSTIKSELRKQCPKNL